LEARGLRLRIKKEFASILKPQTLSILIGCWI
jgi:hypothetical protein